MRGWRFAALVVIALVVALGLQFVASYLVQSRGVALVVRIVGFAVASWAPFLIMLARRRGADESEASR